MPTIDEIISSAVTQLTTKRTNIRTALQSKYNQTIPPSMTFGDVPTYITNVANYQYSLGLADGESSGGGSYMHENNAQLLNSYVATGGQSQHNGTYTKLENTYHRGFNVYKNINYDMYLVCVDDNGNRWQVCLEPSETSYQYKESSDTSSQLGPVGSYPRNTSLSLSGTVVISAPGSSSSATSSSIPVPSSSSGNESSTPSASSSSGGDGTAPDTVYVTGSVAMQEGYAGTYTKQSQTSNGKPVYYCSGTGKRLFVVRNDSYSWVFGTSVSETTSSMIYFAYQYYSSLTSTPQDSPVGLTYNQSGMGSLSSEEFAVSAGGASSSSGGSDSSLPYAIVATDSGDSYANGGYTQTGDTYNSKPVYRNDNNSSYEIWYNGSNWVLGYSHTDPYGMPYYTCSTLLGQWETASGSYPAPYVSIAPISPGDSSSSSNGGNGGDDSSDSAAWESARYSVSGISPSYNGTYTYYNVDGEGGTPKYVHEGVYMYRKLIDGTRYWVIEGYSGGPGGGSMDVVSRIQSNSTTPPTGTWSIGTVTKL